MTELNDSFSKLYGRQLSDSEIQKLYRVRDALGIKNNDALWTVIMALQSYQSEYEKIPPLISKTTTEVLAATAADKSLLTSAAVAASANKIAHNTATKQMWMWAAGCIAISTISLGGISWYMNNKGHESGYNEGYKIGFASAKDENLVNYWAQTPEGESAFQLARRGSLEKLVRCDQPGWKKEGDTCFVKPTKDGTIHGWRIPVAPVAKK